ncbi:13476_t:CDS:2 [Rhizophagus irregularis]|nr:13476_t:CDS:2 [Rhizophagus irregularis]
MRQKGLLNRDNEVLENLDNSTDENYKEYPEETNYENKWDVKVVIEVGQEEDNDESESEKEEDDVDKCCSTAKRK